MLDSETKRRIDACRDILVGKVPDPKSQVEQITIALIYKFMDDMDAEAEELGGHRRFFAGDYARFGWARIMAPGLGGFEVLALYSEAIQTMNKNPGVPPLFRDIFKNAYLPYRDPETLKSFLKEINYFTYDHSERLGDAFEYLLSVLGSQGDAGQFRTPRHIIDFMVEVMDPKKNETILDPACGTAGFLISAWKHILKANTSRAIKNDSCSGTPAVRKAGDLLTPDERARLAAGIRGYDISPDMVRLSLVNLYLHGFTDPRIEEYDTLTSDEKWNEVADVILANPPFMSPKGGIKPHKRFSVQATRSEVLFVDYMAEHLTATGRAAIVVPEGIIFQSGTAYKALRQMLVKTSLVAVVSLPAGVFNPYSGVKTSILILDKRLHKQLDSVLFVKVCNDGFNLGAQRRAVVDSHLPEATRLLRSWMTAPEKFEGNGAMAQAVERARLGKSGDFNLSGERYVKVGVLTSAYEFVELGEVCDLYQPKTITQQDFVPDGLYLVYGANGVIGRYSQYNHEDAEVLITCRGATCGTVNKSQPKSWVTGNAMVAKPKDERLSKDFLFSLMKRSDLTPTISGSAQPQITRQGLAPFQIPLPPLEVQHQIVAEIEGYQKIIDGARQVLDNYKPRIVVSPDWPCASLGDVCDINPKKSQFDFIDANMAVAFVPMSDISEREMLFAPKEQRSIGEVFKQYTYFENEDVLLAKVTPCFENGKSGIARQLTGGVGFGSSEFYVLRAHLTKVLPEWIYFQVTTDRFRTLGVAQMTGTGGLQRVPRDFVAGWLIPLPDLPTQRAIVAEIEAEQALVNANRELIRRFEAKIKTTIDRVWSAA